jgi:mannose-6-phosphate isomerase
MLYPYRFQPILAERVWGGQTLARYGKTIPAGKIIGESWEISDRDDAQSVVVNGALRGKTLRQLIETLGYETIVGRVTSRGAASGDAAYRFPRLVKLLDARERLSLQVHPPADVAPSLGGEPKTEMWYVLDAAPDAHLIAGLKRGATRGQFEAAIRQQPSPLAELVHRVPVCSGDVLFVPSGRLHAIDAGLVIAEIQQNSDTTYRVYDWDRVGLDGKPRALHVKESLASIDFSDFEPPMSKFPIECEYFRVERITLDAARGDGCDGTSFQIIGCADGAVEIAGEKLSVGDFVLLPAALGEYTARPLTPVAAFLKTTAPSLKK